MSFYLVYGRLDGARHAKAASESRALLAPLCESYFLGLCDPFEVVKLVFLAALICGMKSQHHEFFSVTVLFAFCRWVSRGHHECPVCKGDVDKDKVIPLYGRGESSRTDKSVTTGAFSKNNSTPSRPAGQRSEATRDLHENDLDAGGYGFNLFTGNFLHSGSSVGRGGLMHESFAPEHLTPEMQQQVFLSRVLLMLGSFVIMCLLLF